MLLSFPLLCWISKKLKNHIIIMGTPDSTSPLLPPPSPLQIKLYQAFIFSVPVLFTIIIFLLFYLFYLKKTTTTTTSIPSSSLPIQPWRSNQDSALISMPSEEGLKKEMRDNLPVIVYDESLKAQDLQCCVCLGEFQRYEHLNQIISCKHMFHVDCIHHWLKANTTCPLCRASILPAGKLDDSDPPAGSIIFRQEDANTGTAHLGSSHPGSDVEGTIVTGFASEV